MGAPRPNPLPSLSIVICAYTENRWTELLAAVQGMQAQTVSPDEIIVVIDHNDELEQRARQALRGVTILPNRQARGLSGARNTGVAAARGEVVAFMDEDAVPDRTWLARLAAPYADPAVLGVGGAIEPLWETGIPDWFPAEFNWVVGCTYRGMPAGPAPVRNLIGCNMSFRRAIVERAGGFRNGIGRIGVLPVGCEETELCIRIRQHEPEPVLLYIPGARVQHRVPVNRSTLSYFVSRCYAEGLSKAQIAAYVGAQAALSSERTYTFHTLPAGVWQNVRDAVRRADAGGLKRAGAIVLGLAVTTLGYLRGKLQPAAPGSAERVQVGQVDHVGN